MLTYSVLSTFASDNRRILNLENGLLVRACIPKGLCVKVYFFDEVELECLE